MVLVVAAVVCSFCELRGRFPELWLVVVVVVVVVISSFPPRTFLWELPLSLTLFVTVFTVSVFPLLLPLIFPSCLLVVVIVLVVTSSLTFLPWLPFLSPPAFIVVEVVISVVFEVILEPFASLSLELSLEFPPLWDSVISVFVTVTWDRDFSPSPPWIIVFVVIFEEDSLGDAAIPRLSFDSFFIIIFSSSIAEPPDFEISVFVVFITTPSLALNLPKRPPLYLRRIDDIPPLLPSSLASLLMFFLYK